jgi:hypothetical protein
VVPLFSLLFSFIHACDFPFIIVSATVRPAVQLAKTVLSTDIHEPVHASTTTLPLSSVSSLVAIDPLQIWWSLQGRVFRSVRPTTIFTSLTQVHTVHLFGNTIVSLWISIIYIVCYTPRRGRSTRKDLRVYGSIRSTCTCKTTQVSHLFLLADLKTRHRGSCYC